MDDRQEMRELVSPERAREVLAGLDLSGGAETVPLAESRGRVLAEAVTAEMDVPGFDRASVDGYAVRAADVRGACEATPADLAVSGRVRAGERPDPPVAAGTAVEVATGAVLPDGADAVVMVEDTTERDGRVAVRTAVPPGGNVMAAGADVAAGDRALGVGVTVTPRTVGLLAALGRETVEVRARPRVAVVSTGGELVQPGGDPDPGRGQIYDVNTTTVATAVREAGGEPVRYTRVADDREAMVDVLAEAAEACDLLLTSGSTSAGAADLLYRVVGAEGEVLVHGIAVKPGKPTVIGRIDGTPYVGLPGYPVSALSVFRLFVAPRLRRAAGKPTDRSVTTRGRLAVEERYEEGRHRALPVGVVTDGDGETVVYPVDRGSGATTTLAAADGVVEMAADTTRLPPGAEVTVDLFAADARPPAALIVGESDPVAGAVTADLERARVLPWGSPTGRRWLADDVADAAVVTGSTAETDGVVLAAWEREWGVITPRAAEPAAPADLDGCSVATVDRSIGLRAAVDDAVAAAGLDPEVVSSIETAGVESPARRVADGRADAGFGLRATAERLGPTFEPVGWQPVTLVGNGPRRSKPGVERLAERAEAVTADLSTRPGFRS